jgi:hypothetical protein
MNQKRPGTFTRRKLLSPIAESHQDPRHHISAGVKCLNCRFPGIAAVPPGGLVLGGAACAGVDDLPPPYCFPLEDGSMSVTSSLEHHALHMHAHDPWRPPASLGT